MKYRQPYIAELIKRENRFIATVKLNGEVVRAHVPNTGRCKELFIEGATVLLSKAPKDSKRKTNYSLVSVMKNGHWINIDSQAPNKLVKEYLDTKPIFPEIGKIQSYKTEVTRGNSRFDFYLYGKLGEAIMEVKGVTLENFGLSSFPDAPTLRGQRHVTELTKYSAEGETAFIFFVVQMKEVHSFIPNWKLDPDFSQKLLEAHRAGVYIKAMDTKIQNEKQKLDNNVLISLKPPLKMRKTEMKDLFKVLDLYKKASKQLAYQGVNQWQNNYPNKETLINDIKDNISYVFEEKGEIVGTAAFDWRPEVDYQSIDSGHWINHNKYFTIHRIASKKTSNQMQYGRRMLIRLFIYAIEHNYYNIRIDTHKNNKLMKHLLQKTGFIYIGETTIHDGTKRDLYQRVLNE